jgi:hypothetical protein
MRCGISRLEEFTSVMKHKHDRSSISNAGIRLGLLSIAIALAGCDSAEPGPSKPPPASAPAPSAAPSDTAGKAGAPKTDSSSRRQHQKEQAGTTK